MNGCAAPCLPDSISSCRQDPAASHSDYTRRVAELTEFAHRHDVATEAEVGHLPTGTSDTKNNSQMTDPELAARFVQETGVDLLAVSVGNVHVMLKGEQDLDLEQLALISRQVANPLVLHGGTGISANSLREAIALGVANKLWYLLKQRYLKAVLASLTIKEDNPHELLGLGGDRDVMIAGRIAVREAVLERIGLLGCCGKATS